MGWGLHLCAADYIYELEITIMSSELHLCVADYTCGLGITFVGWGLHLWAGDFKLCWFPLGFLTIQTTYCKYV